MSLKRAKVAESVVLCDMAIYSRRNHLVAISMFHKSENLMRRVNAAIASGYNVDVFHGEDLKEEPKNEEIFKTLNGAYLKDRSFEAFVERIPYGNGYMTHGLCLNSAVVDKKGDFFFVENDNFRDSLYNKLLAKYSLPLMIDWMKHLYHEMIDLDYLIPCEVWAADDVSVPFGSDTVKAHELRVYELKMSEEEFERLIKAGLESGAIKIADLPQQRLSFESIDEYYLNYGKGIVENLVSTIKPRIGKPKDFLSMFLKSRRLIPKVKQAHIIQGVCEIFENSSAAILNGGMGTGKTAMASLICDQFTQNQLKKANPDMNEQELTENSKFRACVLCPGHLPEKWAEEIESLVPLAQAHIIDTFEKVLMLKELKGKKPTGKDFFIFPKDFAKLSYMSVPIVKRYTQRHLKYGKCMDCGLTVSTNHMKSLKPCPDCNSKNYIAVTSPSKVSGWICPECGEIVFPNKKRLTLEGDEDDMDKPIDAFGFETQSTKNSSCNNCGTSLWQPKVKQTSVERKVMSWFGKKPSPWLRISRYRNKSKSSNISHWVHEDFLRQYLNFYGVGEDDYRINEREGTRKYAPSQFIKNHLGKGFFDFGIFDEAHLYKGGGSAQGHAFHVLVNASKKSLAMTGTIAGGYASNLFYMLYKLFPQVMKDRGFDYDKVNDFVDRYGVMEQIFEAGSGGYSESYNASSKGKTLSSPRERPGISPMLYSEILMEFSVFIDLNDMAEWLPDLKENPRLIKMPDWLSDIYHSVSWRFQELMNDRANKFKFASIRQQTLAALPDKPYGLKDVVHPDTGEVVIDLEHYADLVDYDTILPKEQELISLLSDFIARGEKAFVYVEFTGDGDKKISDRVKDIIEKNVAGSKVAILTSKSPKASQRVSWIKEQASDGVNVVITNPRCVETGVDFKFEVKNVVHNFNHIVFYQVGADVYTLWQASYRHYRLNQDCDCDTWYLAYENTIQHNNLSLVAAKKHATAAIQGRFSSEGLNAMANGVDSRSLLAENMKQLSGEKMQEMFGSVNQAMSTKEVNDVSSYYENLIYSELVSERQIQRKAGVDAVVSNDVQWKGDLPLFSVQVDTVSIVHRTEDKSSSEETSAGFGLKTVAKRSKKIPEGQCLLFDI